MGCAIRCATTCSPAAMHFEYKIKLVAKGMSLHLIQDKLLSSAEINAPHRLLLVHAVLGLHMPARHRVA